MDNYYEILGVNKNSSTNKIKKIFRKLALKYHPDKNRDTDTHEIFVKINIAYENLKDESSRKKYDILYEKYKSEQNLNNQNSTDKSKKEKDNKKSSNYSESKNDIYEEEFNKEQENYRKRAEEYANITFEQFENLVFNIKKVAKKTKKGIEIGCGYIVFIGSLIFSVFTLISMVVQLFNGKFNGMFIILFIIFLVITFIGWGLSRK